MDGSCHGGAMYWYPPLRTGSRHGGALKGIPRMCQIVLGILDTAASTMGSPTCVLTRQFPIGTCPRVCKLVVFN